MASCSRCLNQEFIKLRDPEYPLPEKRFGPATAIARPATGHALQPEKLFKFEFLGTSDEAIMRGTLLGLMEETTLLYLAM